MKKKIAILGSTGSIGKSLLSLIQKDKKIEIILLSANKKSNYLIQQAKKFKVKNLVITNKKSYLKLISNKSIKSRFNIFNNFDCFKKIFKRKIDYTMSAITGIDGLSPTLDIIKHTKNIAIANKESIICGWDLLKKELKKYNTNFIPVDSEHFSIWFELLSNNKNSNIKKI